MSIPILADLSFIPYIDETGAIPASTDQKIGIYAIYDQDKTLCYVGYSRDYYKSLQQHLVRRPHQCYWFKLHTCDRPSRTLLEDIRQAWLSENSTLPVGNANEETLWTQPIDIKPTLSAEVKQAIATTDDIGQMKLLKEQARLVEAEIKTLLEARGLTMGLRFQPKLKEQGLLDLK